MAVSTLGYGARRRAIQRLHRESEPTPCLPTWGGSIEGLTRHRLHVNGRGLVGNARGPARYATELVHAIAVSGLFDLVIHVPSDAPRVLPAWTKCPWVEVRRARSSGAVFEQCHLPIATVGRRLLNFGGSAPLFKRRQLVTMFDATPFRRPRGFGWMFVARQYVTYRWLARIAEGLLTVSVFSAHELSDVLRVDVDRFIVAPGAADELSGVRPVNPGLQLCGDHYLVIGSAARHENVCRAVETIARSGRSAVVAGTRGEPGVLAGSSAWGEKVAVTEDLTDAELVWLLGNSRALVFPSTYEGFALPVLQAQALGCPVVCSDSAALPEVGGDGALYFDPDDPEMLLAQLDRIDSEPELVDDLRGRGLANARRRSWRASGEKVLEWASAPTRAHRQA